MLKRKISKEDFDALPEALQAYYKAHGAGYVLDTDDAAELETALRRTQEEARAAKERADALQREKDEAEEAKRIAEEEAAKKKGDVSALEASWQAKLDAEKKKGEEVAEKLREQLRRLLVRDKARALAEEISNSPEVILPHIERRLSVEYEGDDARTRVLDSDGKPSAATIEDLKQEFVANDKFVHIIIGSKANGGQSGHSRGGGQPGAKKISDMTEIERTTLYRELGEIEFNRRLTAERGAA